MPSTSCAPARSPPSPPFSPASSKTFATTPKPAAATTQRQTAQKPQTAPLPPRNPAPSQSPRVSLMTCSRLSAKASTRSARLTSRAAELPPPPPPPDDQRQRRRHRTGSQHVTDEQNTTLESTSTTIHWHQGHEPDRHLRQGMHYAWTQRIPFRHPLTPDTPV